MPVDLDTQLRALGDALARESDPITLDELGAGRLVPAPTAPTRRRWITAAAIATAAASLVALVVLVDRDGARGPSTLPAPEAAFVEGALDVDPTSAVADGWTVQVEADVLDGGWGGIVTRRYAIDSAQPETGPALDVATFMDGLVLPNIPEGEPAVQIAGADAWWTETQGPGRGLAFLVDGRWFVVRGYRMTDDQIVTAAQRVQLSPDGVGAIVDDGGLPAGLGERLVGGGMSPIWLFPAGLTGDEVKQVRWADGDRAVSLYAVPADDAFVVASRTAASSVTEAAVGGHPSYVASSDGLPDLRWMAWTQDGWSYVLAGNLVSSDEIVAFANALAPMPAERWTELLNASRPSGEVPVGVEQFPVVADEALDGATRGMYGVWAGPAGEVAYPIVEIGPEHTSVSVRPVGLDEVVASWTSVTDTTLGVRPAATGSSEDWRFAAVDLGDGETLLVASNERPLDDLVALAEAVEFVDQATWDDRYEAIRPYGTAEEAADDIVPATTAAEAVAEPMETLRVGDSESRVMVVQEMLSRFGFDPGPADGEFGQATQQAVWAFETLVMGVPLDRVTGAVTPDVWERVGSEVFITPRRPQEPGVDHVEIYLPEQVMVVFHDDQPVLITHVSTGQLDDDGEPNQWCETITVDTDHEGNPLPEPESTAICGASKTPGGIFDVDRFVPSTRVGPLGAMWNPIYFNYGIAIHGAKNVPLEPASHGNVRVPMHVADRLPDLLDIGEQVYVWDGRKEPEDQTAEDELPVFDWTDPTG